MVDFLLFAYRARRSRGTGRVYYGHDLNFGDGPYAGILALIAIVLLFAAAVAMLWPLLVPPPRRPESKADKLARETDCIAATRRQQRYHDESGRLAGEARQRRREEKIERRDEWYRGRGVEPGQMAWFRALPDVAQAILMGLASPYRRWAWSAGCSRAKKRPRRSRSSARAARSSRPRMTWRAGSRSVRSAAPCSTCRTPGWNSWSRIGRP